MASYDVANDIRPHLQKHREVRQVVVAQVEIVSKVQSVHSISASSAETKRGQRGVNLGSICTAYQVVVPFDDVRQQRTGQASELERRRHCVVAQVEIESKV